MIAALPVSERGDEVEPVDETAFALPHRNENLAAAIGNLGSAARSRKPHRRLVVGADHDGVQVGEAVDLRAAEKSDRDAAALQPVAEHFRHGHRRQRRLAQFAVADRERQHVRLGFDRPRFVDQLDAGRVGEPGEIACGGRQVDSDEAYVAGVERARGGGRHHFGGGVSERHDRSSAGAASRRRCAANASGPLSSTFAFIQAMKPSRSRAIASHAR